ncbi:hypothetical protein ACUXK4_004920 [Methylorubrum extorquens]|nr:hypothetical protein ASF33_18960 [Methylobacterium sp. Leaf92]KQQ06648.1 hypothetical protein ASF59_01950 [Methylobacterium sp. Leaf121]
MDRLRLTPRAQWQPASLKQLQHRAVVRQDFCGQHYEPAPKGDADEVPHQRRANALSLILVDHSERHLGLVGLGHDIASAADDCASAILV